MQTGVFVGHPILDSPRGFHKEPVYIEIPHLDSASFVQDGEYVKDNSKVICVFGNADGGNYVELKGADPGSFKAFRNVFGGRDNRRVYFADQRISDAGFRMPGKYKYGE